MRELVGHEVRGETMYVCILDNNHICDRESSLASGLARMESLFAPSLMIELFVFGTCEQVKRNFDLLHVFRHIITRFIPQLIYNIIWTYGESMGLYHVQGPFGEHIRGKSVYISCRFSTYGSSIGMHVRILHVGYGAGMAKRQSVFLAGKDILARAYGRCL
jgi:hypothetical protein